MRAAARSIGLRMRRGTRLRQPLLSLPYATSFLLAVARASRSSLLRNARRSILLVLRGAYRPSLLRADEVRTPILLPARFIRLRAERLFLTITHCCQAIGGNSQLHQEIPCRLRAPLAEAEVIFG